MKYTTSGCKDIRISNLVKLITSLIQISQTWNSIRSTNSSVTCTPLGCKDMRTSKLDFVARSTTFETQDHRSLMFQTMNLVRLN